MITIEEDKILLAINRFEELTGGSEHQFWQWMGHRITMSYKEMGMKIPPMHTYEMPFQIKILLSPDYRILYKIWKVRQESLP